MVIHDWICGEASQAGQPSGYLERRPDFRTVAREAAAFGESNLKLLSSEGVGKLLDIDPQALNRQIANLDDAGQAELLVQAMAPSQHWTSGNSLVRAANRLVLRCRCGVPLARLFTLPGPPALFCRPIYLRHPAYGLFFLRSPESNHRFV